MAFTQLSSLLDDVALQFGNTSLLVGATSAGVASPAAKQALNAERRGDAFASAEAAWGAASEAERAGILRQVVQLGSLMAAIEPTSMTAMRPDDQSTVWLVTAFDLIASCSRLVGLGGWPGSSSDLFRWLRCASLILTSGTSSLWQILEALGRLGANAGGPNAARSTMQSVSVSYATSQMKAVRALLLLLTSASTSNHRAGSAFAASVAPPDTVLRWLTLAATVVKLAHDSGCSHNPFLPHFADVACLLLTVDFFDRHQAALASAPAQQAQLAALLPAMAAESLLAAAEQGASGEDGTASSSGNGITLGLQQFLQIVALPCLQAGVLAQLQGPAGAGICKAVLLMLHTASEQPAAASQPAATCLSMLLGTAADAWGRVCLAARQQVEQTAEHSAARPGQLPSHAAHSELSRKVALAVLPAQRAAIRRAAEQLPRLVRMAGQLHKAAGVAEEVQEVSVMTEVSVTTFLRGVGEAAQLAEWAALTEVAAGDGDDGWAKAHLYPSMAAAGQLGIAAVQFVPVAAREAATALGSCLAAAGALYACWMAREPAADVDEGREQAVAMRGLHAAACRLVHHWAALEAAAAAEVDWSLALRALEGTGHACLGLNHLGTPSSGQAVLVPTKQLHSCAAAHLAAITAAHRHWAAAGAEPPRRALLVASAYLRSLGIAQCLTFCCSFLGPSQLEEALELAVRGLLREAQEGVGGADSPNHQLVYTQPASLVAVLAGMAPKSPQLAAALVSSGLLAELAHGCIEVGPATLGQPLNSGERRRMAEVYVDSIQRVHKSTHQVLAALLQAVHEAAESDAGSPAAQMPPQVLAPLAGMAAIELCRQPSADLLTTAQVAELADITDGVLLGAAQLAEALQAHWQQPEQAAAAALELALVSATRGCANLRCANLGVTGGPDCGQVAGSKRCSGCRAVRYCSTACQAADWRVGGHRKLCAALGEAREQAEAGVEQAASGS